MHMTTGSMNSHERAPKKGERHSFDDKWLESLDAYLRGDEDRIDAAAERFSGPGTGSYHAARVASTAEFLKESGMSEKLAEEALAASERRSTHIARARYSEAAMKSLDSIPLERRIAMQLLVEHARISLELAQPGAASMIGQESTVRIVDAKSGRSIELSYRMLEFLSKRTEMARAEFVRTALGLPAPLPPGYS